MKSLRRLGQFLKPYWLQIAASLLTLVFLTILQLVLPIIIQRVIDIGLIEKQAQILIPSAWFVLGLGIGIAGLTYIQSYLSEWIAANIGYDLRNRLYDHIQHLSFSYHDRAQTGQLISRCIEDVRSIERFTGLGIVDLVRLSLLMLGIVAILIWNDALLAAIALLPMLPMVIITTDFGRKIGAYFLRVDRNLGELSARLQENVSGVQVVRAFAQEENEIKRFAEANTRLYESRVEVLNQWSRIMPTTHFLVSLGTILILWFGGLMVINDNMTLGEIVAFNSYLLLLAIPARQLTWLVNMAGEAVAGVERTFEILDHKPAIHSPSQSRKIARWSGRVTFNNVCLRYSDQNQPALEDINLVVEPNQIIALIGATGSGKTSLVNLIPRFYDVTKGTVCIDGHDVRELDLLELRKQIGIVLQTSLLFSTTIRENIAYGRPDTSDTDVIEAAQAAQAHEFILRLPHGYETVVGERGITLSGGQRQRVAIARALLLNPRILILDDSTSSVDAQTEKLIQQALETLMEERTTFVIAHRLSTVHRADQILVMDQGQIVARGTHAQLLAQEGLYRQIYNLQLRDHKRYSAIIEALESRETEVYPSWKQDKSEYIKQIYDDNNH